MWVLLDWSVKGFELLLVANSWNMLCDSISHLEMSAD